MPRMADAHARAPEICAAAMLANRAQAIMPRNAAAKFQAEFAGRNIKLVMEDGDFIKGTL